MRCHLWWFAYVEARRPLLQSNWKKSLIVTGSPCFWHKKPFCTFKWQFMARSVIVKLVAPAAHPVSQFNSKGGEMRVCDAAIQLR